jgi:hypothetical protein
VRRLTRESENDEVQKSDWPSSGDGVVREHVCQRRDFTRQRQVAPEELPEKWGERAAGDPVSERVEDDFRDSPSVLLPSVDFVATCKGDSFFELVIGVGCPSHGVSFQLQSHGHGEIFGDVCFGPDFLDAILFEHDILQRGPSQKGIVADERCTGSVGAVERDRQLNAPDEMCDAVFEEVMGDLHDAGGMLNDSTFGTGFELGDGVHKAVLRYSSIRVDDQNDGAAIVLSACSRLSSQIATHIRIFPSARA